MEAQNYYTRHKLHPVKQALTVRSATLFNRFVIVFGYGFARDGKWMWSMKNDDVHTDIISLAVIHRENHPPVLRFNFGPVALALLITNANEYTPNTK